MNNAKIAVVVRILISYNALAKVKVKMKFILTVQYLGVCLAVVLVWLGVAQQAQAQTAQTMLRVSYDDIDMEIDLDFDLGFSPGESGSRSYLVSICQEVCLARTGDGTFAPNQVATHEEGGNPPVNVEISVDVADLVNAQEPGSTVTYHVRLRASYDNLRFGCPEFFILTRVVDVTVPRDVPVAVSGAYLSDVAQNLAGSLVDAVGEHLSSPVPADSSFAAWDAAQHAFEPYAVRRSDSASLPEDTTVRSLLRERGAATFRLHGKHAGSEAGANTLWARVGVRRFEGRTTGEDVVGFAGELLSATVGFDVPMSDRATVGLGVSHTDGDGTLGDGTTDVSLFSVHPYVRWQLSPRTQVWGQAGLGNGNLQVRDADGDVTLDEDFKVTFVTVGSSSELPTQVIKGASFALKTDARAVQVDGDANRELDSETWRLRTALEVRRSDALPAGGVLQPSLEIGVRYDGGDTQTGLGADTVAKLRLEDAQRGLVIEGSGRYLLVHHESSKRQWGASALVSVDAGAIGHGLAFSLRPSYGISDSQGVDIWRDRLPTEKSNEAALQVAATLSYGTGALGGRAIATPYGSYSLGKAGRHTLREGLRVRLASEGMHVDSYIEQQSGGDERSEQSFNIRMGIDF